MSSVAEHPRRAAFNAAGLLGVVAGAALFAVVLWRADPREVWQGIAGLGWWFAAIVVIGGLRFLARAAAWSACVEPPHRLPIVTAFAGVLAGDTVGNLTPLGPVLGEPAKAAYVRGSVPGSVAFTALAIENLLYTLSAAAMIAGGTLALLFTFELPRQVRQVGELAVAGVVVLFATSVILLWRRPALLSRLIPLVAKEGSALHYQGDRVRGLEQQIYTFALRRPAALVTVAGCEGVFHALGVVEAYITLHALTGHPPLLLTAFVLETAQRLMTVVFKIVPFQIGVGELGTAAVTNVLGLGATIGVTAAVIRKGRMAAWALVGAALLARRGIRLGGSPEPQPGAEPKRDGMTQ
jgi:hypothetical protein